MHAINTAAVPAFHRFFIDVVHALKALGGSGTNQEIYAKVIALGAFTDTQINILYKDGPMTILERRLRWTQTYLKRDGCLENVSRGVWSLSPRGRTISDAELAMTKERLQGARETARPWAPIQSASPTSRQTPFDEELSTEIELAWNAQLLAELKAMDPIAFERLSQQLLRAYGFSQVAVTPASADGGIDGVGILRVNLISFQVMFQCKRYAGFVGPGAIRDFRGAMQGRSDKGLMITTGTFTRAAVDEAVRDGAPMIDLIDGDALCDLLKDKCLGVKVDMVERVTVEPQFFQNI